MNKDPIATPVSFELRNRAWWRYGHVWLVISGPMVVVIAALATAYIAFTRADPVLAEDYYRRGIAINKTIAIDTARLAAEEARNHAATPKTK